MVFCLAYPPLNTDPDGLAVGLVAGQPDAIEDRLTEEGLDVHAYDDAEEARQAIRDREVYGAVVLAPPEPTVMAASAATTSLAVLAAWSLLGLVLVLLFRAHWRQTQVID